MKVAMLISIVLAVAVAGFSAAATAGATGGSQSEPIAHAAQPQAGCNLARCWIKVPRSDIVSGSFGLACARVLPGYYKAACVVIVPLAWRLLNRARGGVWAEIFVVPYQLPVRFRYRYGTW